ncbi:unnamed protein product [Amoebophrya sp. A120]|nr:unnamed protein product [Amoebophrya sp. A120]|eukprot:GSA120T00000152001.1
MTLSRTIFVTRVLVLRVWCLLSPVNAANDDGDELLPLTDATRDNGVLDLFSSPRDQDEDVLELRWLTSNASGNLSSSTALTTQPPVFFDTSLRMAFSMVPTMPSAMHRLKVEANKATGKTYCATVSGSTGNKPFATGTACEAAEGAATDNKYRWAAQVQWLGGPTGFGTIALTPVRDIVPRRRELSAHTTAKVEYLVKLTAQPTSLVDVAAVMERMKEAKAAVTDPATGLTATLGAAVAQTISAAGIINITVAVEAVGSSDPIPVGSTATPASAASGLTTSGTAVGIGILYVLLVVVVRS